jgi:uncharacterized OB-fold protein
MNQESGAWLWHKCYECGHALAFSASACPQCGEEFDGRATPEEFPDECECPRCERESS